MKKNERLNKRIDEIVHSPMKLDFLPEYKSNLKYMVQWTIGELRNTVYGDEDAMDALEEIIRKSGF